MVITVLMALQLAAATPAPPLGELPQQEMTAGQCALFLWDRATGKRIAMLIPVPPSIRAVIDGRLTDLPREAADGTAVMGFAPNSRYRSANRNYDIRLTILPATTGGAVVRDGSLTITENDGSALVLSVAGLAGCPQ
jgi:hypothetical protein